MTKKAAHPKTTPPPTNPTNTSTPGLTSLIPPIASPNNDRLEFFKFELVLPNCSLSVPECPFEVTNTDRATVAVLKVLVYVLVENVFVA